MKPREKIYERVDFIDQVFENADHGIDVDINEYEIVEDVSSRMVPDNQVLHIVHKIMYNKFSQRIKR